jgi:hypothetical protein
LTTVAGATQGEQTPFARPLPASQVTAVTVRVVDLLVGPKLPTLGWDAVMVDSPAPLIVTRAPSMVATAVFELVKVKGAGLFELGAARVNGSSVSFLLIAGKSPSGGPSPLPPHATIRHATTSQPNHRFMGIPWKKKLRRAQREKCNTGGVGKCAHFVTQLRNSEG